MLERLMGAPERLDGARLRLALRAGAEGYVAQCLRAFALREPPGGDIGPLLLALGQGAARRRAAAWGLGWRGERRATAALAAAWEGAYSHADLLVIGVARVRCGVARGPILARLEGMDQRRISSFAGWKEPQAALDQAPVVEQFLSVLGLEAGEAGERRLVLADALRAQRQAALAATERSGGRGEQEVRALALLGHPGDLQPLVDMLHSSGRRGEHAIHRAIALAGDCRAERRLTDLLEATDADPGRGFVQRRLGALGLGRLGLAASLRVLERAVESERRDFEGRPGAGLGVQFPVRGELLLAIGELAESGLRALPLLIAHLDDTTGSAFGGMYLPAMEAICRIGPGALQGLRQRARAAARGDAGEIGAANAVGVIAALGGDVTEFLGDRRTVVAAAAKRAQQAGRVST